MTSTVKSLRTYLDELRSTGELLTVNREVDLQHELSAVTKLTEPAGAPALWFSAVRGHSMPVVTALFGRRDRIARALGVPTDQAVEHVLEAQSALVDAPIEPLQSAAAPVQQVVCTGQEASLDQLPIGVHSAEDAGRYLTCAVAIVRDPTTGNINTGIYRLMVDDAHHLTVNAAPNHDLGRIMRGAGGTAVEVAFVIGHHPAYLIASQLKNPMTVDAHQLAARLLGEPLRTVPARTVDLPVPADAEIVIEATIHTADLVNEGPFGEFTYYYGKATAPRAEITAITHRADALFHDLHPTHAEHRCLWLYPGREARLLAAVRAAVPDTAAVRIPFAGGSLSAYLSLRKRHEYDGKQAILAAFAADHFLKHVYAIDTDVDITDDQQVLWAMNVRFQARTDLVQLTRAKGIRMDPSAEILTSDGIRQAVTDKLGFDATKPITVEFPPRADETPQGMCGLKLEDWFDATDNARLQTVLSTRHALAE
jgi:2,5-furandicarboxylate decarboxylase 1